MVRLASILHNGKVKIAAQLLPEKDTSDDSSSFLYCDLTAVASNAREFLSGGADTLEAATALIQETSLENLISSAHVKLLAPLDGSLVGKFICIGMNYKDHCLEQNCPIPDTPLVFSKFSSAIVGTHTPVVKDEHVTQLDYEVELGVVIGKTVPRFTSDEDALQYVGGYTVIHDVSARDWQLDASKNGGQWLLGKTMDGYAPMGPVLVTSEELKDPHNLEISCTVSGKVLQQSNTGQLVFSVPEIVSYLSQFFTLQPGDVIATGTPPGVGCFRTPPRWLVPGDIVECTIQSIGTLVTPIVEADYGPGKPSIPLASSPSSFQPHKGQLAGLHCLVTGAARGLGQGIAARLGLEGAASVTCVDANVEDVARAAKSLQRVAPSCTYHAAPCDVTDAAAVSQTWAAAAARNGNRLDILVQAAGIVGETNQKCESVSLDNFDQVMRVNVGGIFLGCKAALPYMVQQKFGRIINIASIAGKEGNAGMLAYSSSKAAVIGLTKSIGKEYAETGVTCNALAPAVVRTQMVEDMPEAQVKYMTDKIPMKRCGTIEEIASMVCFMASPEASFTTGFCFDATGGRAVY